MKIIRDPWLRRGLYAEGVSVVCGHIEAIRSPLFLRLRVEKEGMWVGCVWGKIENGEADIWDGGREKDGVERG